MRNESAILQKNASGMCSQQHLSVDFLGLPKHMAAFACMLSKSMLQTAMIAKETSLTIKLHIARRPRKSMRSEAQDHALGCIL